MLDLLRARKMTDREHALFLAQRIEYQDFVDLALSTRNPAEFQAALCTFGHQPSTLVHEDVNVFSRVWHEVRRIEFDSLDLDTLFPLSPVAQPVAQAAAQPVAQKEAAVQPVAQKEAAAQPVAQKEPTGRDGDWWIASNDETPLQIAEKVGMSVEEVLRLNVRRWPIVATSKLRAQTLLRLDDTVDFDDYPKEEVSKAKVSKAKVVDKGKRAPMRTASAAAMGGGRSSKRAAVACEYCHQMFHCQGIGRHRDACREKAIAHSAFLG